MTKKAGRRQEAGISTGKNRLPPIVYCILRTRASEERISWQANIHVGVVRRQAIMDQGFEESWSVWQVGCHLLGKVTNRHN